jgi:acyl-CoA reductase-like NAD-dependent aldehyde dehydrogenase
MLTMPFTRQRQSCTVSWLLMRTDVHGTFKSAMVQKVNALNFGDPLDRSFDIGSIVNAKQFESELRHVKDGNSNQASTWESAALPLKAGHEFLQPDGGIDHEFVDFETRVDGQFVVTQPACCRSGCAS